MAIAKRNNRYLESASRALNGEVPLATPLTKGAAGNLPGNDTDVWISDKTFGSYYR